MPRILKADNLRAHCRRTMTKQIPQESPAPSQAGARLTAARALALAQVPGIVGERSTNIKSGTRQIYGLKVTVHAAQAPSGESGSQRRAAEKTCGGSRQKRTTQQLDPQGAMLTLTWCGLTLP